MASRAASRRSPRSRARRRAGTERLLRNLARRLELEAPGVAASILEGLDEMLTVNRLGLPTQLRRSLACTNSIENMMGDLQTSAWPRRRSHRERGRRTGTHRQSDRTRSRSQGLPIVHRGRREGAKGAPLDLACCVVEWLNQNPAQSTPGHCLGCGGESWPGNPLLPFGTETHGHVWLHGACWPAWYRARQADAVAALSCPARSGR